MEGLGRTGRVTEEAGRSWEKLGDARKGGDGKISNVLERNEKGLGKRWKGG